MKARCYCETHPVYPRYGGVGIKVCERWLTFTNFLADMGERPEGMEIDRKDTCGDYTPDNCKWSTLEEKGSNRKTNRWLTANGETRTLKQWEEYLGLDHVSLWERLKKWPIEKALTTPKFIPALKPKARYGGNWVTARKAAMQAAGGNCQRCKKAKAVHVHHKLPVRYFAKPEDANFPQNLMAVCRPCHKLEHKEMSERFPLLDILEGNRKVTRRDNRGLKRFITWQGQTKTAAEWGRSIGNPYPSQYVINRLRRYPFEKAMEPFSIPTT